MALISVTATLTFIYDTDDGLVRDAAEAIEDMRETITNGVYDFDYSTKED